MDLPPDYYVLNFRELTRCVAEWDASVLSPEEQQFLENVNSLPEASERLLVRMLMRKGDLFRVDRLQYPEIGDPLSAARELEALGMVLVNPDLQAEALLSVFTKADWLRILEQVEPGLVRSHGLRSAKKDALHEVVLKLNPVMLNQALPTPLIQLVISPVFEVLKFLFFGNRRQDLTEFVLSDLGIQQFADYRVDASTRLFQSRAQLDAHLAFHALQEEVGETLPESLPDLQALLIALPHPTAGDRFLNRKVETLRFSLARQLERQGELEEALDEYRLLRRHPSRERQARILLKCGQGDEALALCREILAEPFNEEEAVFARGFGARTARKLNRTWPVQTMDSPETVVLQLPRTDERVELAVAASFAGTGRCHYVENRLVGTLFGLLYWDVIFAPVPGAFTHPFQYRPHDLSEPDFLDHRVEPFSAAHGVLNCRVTFTELILDRWDRTGAVANPFFGKGGVDEDCLRLALERVPLAHLQAVFERMWADVKANRAGFPDLILFPDDGPVQWIEVKGPGDRLQANQLRWMNCFAQHGIPHRVVHVEWTD